MRSNTVEAARSRFLNSSSDHISENRETAESYRARAKSLYAIAEMATEAEGETEAFMISHLASQFDIIADLIDMTERTKPWPLKVSRANSDS
jgi:hypothetical protein